MFTDSDAQRDKIAFHCQWCTAWQVSFSLTMMHSVTS